MKLAPEQIWDINQQRRELISESNSYLMHNSAGEMPQLTDAMQYKYYDYVDGDANALKGVTSKQLDTIQKRAKYDLTNAHENITRTSYDASTDGYKYQSTRSNGEKWADAVSELRRAQTVYDSIKSLQKKRADEWVKKHSK